MRYLQTCVVRNVMRYFATCCTLSISSHFCHYLCRRSSNKILFHLPTRRVLQGLESRFFMCLVAVPLEVVKIVRLFSQLCGVSCLPILVDDTLHVFPRHYLNNVLNRFAALLVLFLCNLLLCPPLSSVAAKGGKFLSLERRSNTCKVCPKIGTKHVSFCLRVVYDICPVLFFYIFCDMVIV